MTNYINFSAMSSLERHVFQVSGECSAEFHMGEEEFNQMVDEIVHKQAMQQELVMDELAKQAQELDMGY